MKKLFATFTRYLHAVWHAPPWLLGGKDRLAMAMAIVAVFGAAAAYCAARAEQAAGRLEARLDQGEMLELSIRQGIRSNHAQFTRFDDGYRQSWKRGEGLAAEAEAARKQNASGAALLDIRAEEQFAQARNFLPFRRFTEVGLAREGTSEKREAETDRQVSSMLTQFGFETLWVQEAGPEESRPSIWLRLNEQIRRGNIAVRRLASSVVVFVCSLVCFTVVHLKKHKASKMRWSRLGYLAAFAGLIIAGWNDAESWKTFGKFALGLPILMLLGWVISAYPREWDSIEKNRFFGPVVRRLAPFIAKRRWLRKKLNWVKAKLEEFSPEAEDPPAQTQHTKHHHEHERHPEVEEVEAQRISMLRMPLGSVDRPFSRLVVFLIAITALASALSGLTYSLTTIWSSQAAAKALDFQVDRVKESVGALNEAHDTLRKLSDGLQYQTHLWAARQRLMFAEVGSSKEALDQARLQVRMLKDPPEGVTPDTLKTLNGPLGPDQDPYFPNRLLLPDLLRLPETLFAEGDGENEISLVWRRRATGFLRSLTLFAIALYLFGQSLGMGRTRAAFILAFYAAGLVLAGAATPFLGMIKNRVPSEPKIIQAAVLYGDARVDYELNDLEPAISKFKSAIALRPSFALAHYYLARAESRHWTPQQQGNISHVSTTKIQEIVDAEEKGLKALDSQELSAPLDYLGDHGFDYILLGMCHPDQQHARFCIRSGIDHTVRALSRMARDAQQAKISASADQNYSLLLFNLGLAHLAEGTREKDEGDHAYKDGLKSLAALPDNDDRDDVAAGALSDLNTLRKYCIRFNDGPYCDTVQKDTARLKTAVIRAAWSPLVESSDARFILSDLYASPSGLGWNSQLSQARADRDHLAIVVYACDADPADFGACDSDFVGIDARKGHWGVWWAVPSVSGRADLANSGFKPYRNSDGLPACLPRGKYRAEFYLNGDFADGGDVTLDSPELEAADFRDLNVALCHPKGWDLWQPSDPEGPGLLRGFRSSDQSRGVFVFTSYLPTGATQIAERFAVLQARLTLESSHAIPSISAKPLSGVCAEYLNQTASTLTGYQSGTGSLLTKVWTTPEGIVHVGLVYRTQAAAAPPPPPGASPANPAPTENPEDCSILSSMVTID